jgi:hypothetical protein
LKQQVESVGEEVLFPPALRIKELNMVRLPKGKCILLNVKKLLKYNERSGNLSIYPRIEYDFCRAHYPDRIKWIFKTKAPIISSLLHFCRSSLKTDADIYGY